MKTEQKSLRFGAAVILLAVVLRLGAGGFFTKVSDFLTGTAFPSVLLFLETGRLFSNAPEEDLQASTDPQATAPQPTEPEEPTEPVYAVFSPEDAQLVSVTNYPGISLDVEALLAEPLSWDLTSGEPAVLILHTHTCESYENTEGYTPSSDYRTLDEHYNMISIGAYLAQELEKQGITVIHDTTVHDHPSYNGAYARSMATAESWLEKYPSIRIVLDVHRDAYTDSAGNQLSNTVSYNGVSCSRLMFLMGTNAGGDIHPNWSDNLALAMKLQVTLEHLCPGVTRPICLRRSSFNQHISSGAMLVEVGTAGDTRQEALAAAGLLAEAIAALAHGTE